MSINKRLWEALTDTRGAFPANSCGSTKETASGSSTSCSDVTTVVSEEIMKEFDDRDKALRQREEALEFRMERFRDEKIIWEKHIRAQKEHLRKKMEKDKTEFEAALAHVTQMELNQLVEEHEAHKRALLAVIAVFYLGCVAFEIQILFRNYAQSAKGGHKLQTQALIPKQTVFRRYELMSIIVAWVTLQMDQLNQIEELKTQTEPIGETTSQSPDGTNEKQIMHKNQFTRHIFVSIVIFEVVFLIGFWELLCGRIRNGLDANLFY